ncbi:MAG: JmjC domain-containing protein [Betaproteobacteria bacterium]
MDITSALRLLGGLSPAQFMRRHWQKRPLLVRQAIDAFKPVLTARELCELASREEVESRLVVRAAHSGKGVDHWTLRQGPFSRRALPPLRQPGWTLLVQGVDQHHRAAHDLLQRFRFLPDARLDDLMISLASEGGGVGPHFDSYDVFLLQASGSRRWRIGPQSDLSLRADLPLKILRRFEPQEEHVLQAGDMLYLPPGYAHDGLAMPGRGEPCMTYSIGFRAPSRAELASALLVRMAESLEEAQEPARPVLYRDAGQPATAQPAVLPEALIGFAQRSLEKVLKDPKALRDALGRYLSEPKPGLWFEPCDETWGPGQGLAVHGRTRMMYAGSFLFVNGERFQMGGADARWLRRLADERRLGADEVQRLSAQARLVVLQWLADGWLTLHRDSSGQ